MFEKLKMFGATKDDKTVINFIVDNKMANVRIMEIAMENARDLIAKTIAKCEIKVLRKQGKHIKYIKDENYYRYNIKPNANETGFSFWRKAINKLLAESEVLIISLENGDMFIADSYVISNDVISSVEFSSVQITANDNSIMLNRTFDMSEVLYLRNDNIKKLNLMQKMNADVTRMTSTAISSYQKSNASKYKAILNAQTSFKSRDGSTITTDSIVKDIKDKLSSEDTEVLISQNGIDYQEIVNSSTNSVDDFIKLVDKVTEFVAFIYDIPVDIFVGKKTEKSNAGNDFITFGIKPIKEIIEDTINSTHVSKKEYLRGEGVFIDTTRIKHYDILDISGNLEQLFRQGFTHNDILEIIEKPPIDEAWADERYVTKNYEEKGGK